MNLKEQLKRHEGYKLKPYKCPAGFRTIGAGHNYDANPLPEGMAEYLDDHGRITDEMADQLLERDIAAARSGCEKLYPRFKEFSEARQNALIDMMFNMGYRTLRSFKITNLLINSNNWTGAADNLVKTKWYRQVKGRAKTVCSMLREG